MPSSRQIIFRGVEPSEAVRNAVEGKIGKLEKICDNITSCRVVIEAPHRHHQKGKLYHVRLDLTLPGDEIVINRAPRERRAHEDVYVAVRDAFDAARERMERYVQRRKGKVKAHEAPSHGTIVRLLTDEGCGFIATPDGREVYFHRHSVLGKGFEALKTGMEVRFSEEQGNEGPQASSVFLIGKHHIA